MTPMTPMTPDEVVGELLLRERPRIDDVGHVPALLFTTNGYKGLAQARGAGDDWHAPVAGLSYRQVGEAWVGTFDRAKVSGSPWQEVGAEAPSVAVVTPPLPSQSLALLAGVNWLLESAAFDPAATSWAAHPEHPELALISVDGEPKLSAPPPPPPPPPA